MAGRAVVRDAALKWLNGEDRRIALSVANHYNDDGPAGRVADDAVQIHGGTGYMRGVAVERIRREVRLLRLYEGTSTRSAPDHRRRDYKAHRADNALSRGAGKVAQRSGSVKAAAALFFRVVHRLVGALQCRRTGRADHGDADGDGSDRVHSDQVHQGMGQLSACSADVCGSSTANSSPPIRAKISESRSR